MGAIIHKEIADGFRTFRNYISRFRYDGGLMLNSGETTRKYIDLCKQKDMYNSIKFAWLGEAGGKLRTSGANQFWTKAYSLVTTNDATQTTSTSQPYIAGNIAPTEKLGMKNPNGGSLYMTHPTISFAANEAWSVTTVLNWSGGIRDQWYISSNSNVTLFGLAYADNRLSLRNESGAISSLNGYSTSNLVGKNIIITKIARGNGELKWYVNGLYVGTLSIATNILVNKLFGATTSISSTISSHIIRSQALTESQVLAEANFLRSLYPEIPSVTIGSQVWATSNCEMVATPQGNLIANVTDNTNVEKITNAADREFSSDTGFWTKDATLTISGGTLNANVPLGSQAYLSRAGVSVGKMYKITFTISNYTRGVVNFYPTHWSASGQIDFTANGTYTLYATALKSYFPIRFYSAVLSLDNVSVQEIGWAGSTDLYNGIYAQTAGTDEQKTYAAVKAAAMWCYYNNDAALGAVYGKLYNWYAVKLLQMDIDYYNAANPTTPWGWRVPADTDFNTLATTLGGASVAGGKMKKDGLVYWLTPNTGADNSSGFSLLPSGFKTSGGYSGSINNQGSIWTITSQGGTSTRYYINNTDVALSNQNYSNIGGFSLRLIKG